MTRRNRLNSTRQYGFTLVELLVSLAILSVLASAVLFAMSGVMEQAKAERTRAQIAKIHALLMDKWEEYEVRRVEIDRQALDSFAPQGTPRDPRQLRDKRDQQRRYWELYLRLQAVRELARRELPERKSDVVAATYENLPAAEIQPGERVFFFQAGAGIQLPANVLWQAYRRIAFRRAGSFRDANWSHTHESSECLYLILSRMQDGDRSAIEFFSSDEIGDLDNDGMPEVLDGWGRPLRFLRWAPGFSEVLQDNGDGTSVVLVPSPSALQTRNAETAPEANDPLQVDPRWDDTVVPNNIDRPFALFPLVYSAGPDEQFDIFTRADQNFEFDYINTSLGYRTRNKVRIPPVEMLPDPYTWFEGPDGGMYQFGSYYDGDGDGDGSADNIHNHSF